MIDPSPLLPYIYLFSGLLAACIGSFSNVVICRVPEGKSIVYPPSACPKCGHRIAPYDNVPILSWLFLRGKCRHCHDKISVQYPLVELLVTLLGLGLAYKLFSPSLSAPLPMSQLMWFFVAYCFLLIFVAGCVIQAIIDLKTTELPHGISITVALFGILFAFLLDDSKPFHKIVGNVSGLDAILGAIIGGALIFIIIAVYFFATRRIGMGGGDISMMVMVGAFTGWEGLLFVLFAASIQGILVSVPAALAGAGQQNKDRFGLFRNQILKEDSKVSQSEKGLETMQSSEPSSKEQNADETGKYEIIVDPDEDKLNNISSELESVETGKLAVPFGPFIALAAIEYIFLGDILLPLMTKGFLTPWGMMPVWH